LLTPSPKLLGTDKRKMSKSYGNSILLSDEAPAVEQKIKNSVTDRPKLTDRGSPDRCPVGNLHQIFSDKERLAHITQGCTQAMITCVECKALAVESVNAHLAPIRERRHALAQNPAKLQQTIQHGAQKAIAAAEETMSAVRDAIGLLRISAVKDIAMQDASKTPLRVQTADLGYEEQWEIRTKAWRDKISKTLSLVLSQTAKMTFETRGKRRVGLHTASDQNGIWTFLLKDRHLDVLVLIGEDAEGFLHDYVLPPKLVQDLRIRWKKSMDADKRVFFTVKKIANATILSLGDLEIPIDQYESSYSPLQ
jgi:tryptophanyl-tRNA synthetase